MATFFGEISPLSSRAVDDEEIDDQPIYNLILDSEEDCPAKIDCKLLVFSVDEISYAFVQCYLVPDNAQRLFVVNYSLNKDEDYDLMYTGSTKQKSNVKIAATVYSIDENVIVCDIASRVPEELYTELYDALFDKLNCEEALILTSLPTASFKSEASQLLEKPFLKSIATSKYLSMRSCNVPRLQAPNFLSNFAAAVLTDFEVKQKPAICILNYVDSCLLDFVVVQNFDAIFDENFVLKLTPNSDATSKLTKCVKQKIAAEANLYT
ncbi:Proteasome assembly chaperone 1 like protein [Argiope bruennichi]|uniref:Proteasome assembly chaperone 1 n=1 Tax=Argiope bruennichi TaxID=94029 RepID=A0A8T0EFI9_ARGBR|nr:Proteasome assembly chaperone 1 like protein [Argiope bruennichi]